MLGDVFLLVRVSGVVFGLSLMLLPTLVAAIRNHPNTRVVFLLNLLLGWTGVGWIGALVWACNSPVPYSLHTAFPATSLDPALASSASSSLAVSASSQGLP